MDKALRITVLFRGKQLRAKSFRRDRILIGRDPECDLTLFNIGVSRHHARIERHDGGYELCDLGSSNGTYADGRRIKVLPIEDGTRVRLTKFELQFHLVGWTSDDTTRVPQAITGFTEERTMSLADE